MQSDGDREGDEARSDEARPDEAETNEAYIDDVDRSAVVGDDQLQVTPRQHERLKDAVHGHDRFDDLARAARTYLVVGSGGADGPGRRRHQVCRQLDDRAQAAAVRLEDFELTDEDLELWAPAFDILSAMASSVVGVLEDFDGGHVWELGYLYHRQRHVRDVLWLLKRIYDDDTMRDRYDNGMAASHLAALEAAAGDRVIEWSAEDDLPDAVREIP